MAKGDDAGNGTKYGGNAYGGFFKPTGTAVAKPQMGSGSNPYGTATLANVGMGMGNGSFGIGPSHPLPSGNRFGYNNPAPPAMNPPMGNRFGYNNPAPPVADSGPAYGGNIDSGPGLTPMNGVAPNNWGSLIKALMASQQLTGYGQM